MNLGRLFDGQIRGPRSSEYLVNVRGGAMPRLDDVGPVFQKAAGLCKADFRSHCGKPVPKGSFCQLHTHCRKLWGTERQESGGTGLLGRLHGPIDVVRAVDFDRHDDDVQTPRGLDHIAGSHLVMGTVRDLQ